MKWLIHPQMLIGLGAVVIPLVLHLLSRARHRSVNWGAMMFLENTQARHRQGGKIRQYILLLMRSAIIAQLVFAMARPIVGSRVDENAQVTAIILLDRSASMSCDDGGVTRFDRAKEAAYRVLSSLRRGDRAMILPLGDDSGFRNDQPSTDLQAVAAKLAALTVSPSEADVADGLRRAESALSMITGRREIYLICDRQAVSFRHVDASLSSHEKSIHLLGIPIGQVEAENVAVHNIRLASPLAIRGRELTIIVELQNFSGGARTLPLTLSADGLEVGTQTVTVPPRSSSNVSFRASFAETGTKIVTAAIKSGSSSQDDHLDFALDVIEPISVLVAGDAPADLSIPKLALTPFSSAGMDRADLAEVTVTREIPADLSPFQVVILSNAAFITPAQSRQLQEFVYRGGGVLVAPGMLTRGGVYDQLAWLPGKLSDPTPPSLAAVAHWKRAEFSRIFPIEPRGEVIGKFDDGRPLATQWSLGSGKVMLLGAPLDLTWSNFPETPDYLPFVQGAAMSLASGWAQQRNLDVGQRLLLNVPAAAHDLFIVTPDGQEQSLEISHGVALFRETARPGIYRVVGLDHDVQFVVRPPREESDLTSLTAAKWEEISALLGMRSVDARSAGELPRFPAQEIWGPLMISAALLMLLEERMAHRWGGRR